MEIRTTELLSLLLGLSLRLTPGDRVLLLAVFAQFIDRPDDPELPGLARLVAQLPSTPGATASGPSSRLS